MKNTLKKPSLLPPTIKLYHNCKIYTGQTNQPTAEAFAVLGNKFIAVGSLDHVHSFLPDTSADIKLVNLKGAYVTPGLIDAHLHLISGGLSLHRLDLRPVASKEQFINAVHAAVKTASPGEWIQGANWDESKWEGGEVPTAAWINEVSQHNPVFLTRMDAHQAVVNDLAMKLANLTADTPDPPGGVITRDPTTQKPTGLLSDAAMLLVSSAIPPKTIEQRLAGFLAAQEHLLSLGITSVHDMGRIAFLEGEDAAWDDLEQVYLPAADDGSLKIRINVFVPLPTWRRLAERVKHVGTRHSRGKLMWGGVKEFYDGSLGSRTALMHEPYRDQNNDDSSSQLSGRSGGGGDVTTGTGREIEKEQAEEQLFGTRTVDRAVFREQIQGAHKAGLQIAVHAIGDRAVDEVLEAYADLENLEIGNKDKTKEDMKSETVRDLRHRIEHAQHTRDSPAIREKLAKLGVVITPNPLHLVADKNILESRLGKERVDHGSYAFKTLCSPRRMNATVCAFASDWPVVPLNPALTLHAASLQSRKERVSSEEAFRGITSGAAFVGHREKEIGRIAPGLVADFVVFRSDIMDTSALDYADVSQTFIDGVCVYGLCEGGVKIESSVDGGEKAGRGKNSKVEL
jgi:predicted amidohydrolase YtcJ